MTDNQFVPGPPPRSAADRIARDIADVRMAARCERRLRIVERIASSVFNAVKSNSDNADHVLNCAEYVVDQLEAIVEPSAEEK